MQIVVNTDKLRSTANKLEGIISDLSQKRNNLIKLQSNLDYSIRYARNINQTIVNLSSRLSEAQSDLNRIKIFLNTTADKYEIAEENINAAFQRMCELTEINTTGDTNNKPKWYETTAAKIAIGTLVVVGTVAGAIAVGPAVAAGAVSAVVGTAIKGAAVGAVVGAAWGYFSGKLEGQTGNELATSFMTGAITGSVSGGITGLIGEGLGIVASALVGGGTGFVTKCIENLLTDQGIFDGALGATLTGAIVGGVTSTPAVETFMDNINNYVISASDKIAKSIKLPTSSPSWLNKLLYTDMTNSKALDKLIHQGATSFLQQSAEDWAIETSKAVINNPLGAMVAITMLTSPITSGIVGIGWAKAHYASTI